MSLRSLTRLGQALAGAVAERTAIEHVTQALRRTLAPDHLLVVLAQPETGQLAVAYDYQYAKPRPDDPLVSFVIRHGARVLSDATGHALGELGLEVDYPVGSWIGVPIQLGGLAVGGMSLIRDAPGSYGDWQLDFTVATAALLAITLDNSRLLQLLSLGKLEWEQTVDAISQAFCLVDADQRIRRANRAFGLLVDRPLTTLSGQPWRDVLPAHWARTVEQALAAPRPTPLDLAWKDRTFSLTAFRLITPPGTAVLVFQDDTEMRRLQDQLIQSEKMSAIGQLIAGVAHDLNNPLASVVGFADFLIEAGDVPPRLRQPLEAIRDEAERAAKIVRSLLSFARKHEGEHRPQPIAPIIEATLILLKNQLTALRIDARTEIEPDLPPVAVDANRIQQVFVNVINNAAQAMHGSGIGDTITIRAFRDGALVVVTIADNGPGIPPEIAGRIFEPFFTTKPEGEGTGLGLSICHGIVREHDGRMLYQPGPRGGALFRIELPAAKPVRPTETPAPRPPDHLRILVVDDEPHILHYMRATLEAWGHEVTVAGDGRSALAAAATQTFDLVITDLRMPTLDGREFYEILRDQFPALADRVVFATGDTVRGDTLAFLESQRRPYLRKPFTLAELKAVLAARG